MAKARRSSPYHRFTKAEWAKYRDGEPMTLTAEDIARLRSLNDPISLEEAEAIYLPLTRLLSLLCRGGAGRSIARRRSSSASKTTRCPSSSASPARSRSASRPPRASLRRCSGAGRRRPRSTSSPPTASSIPTAFSKSAASWTARVFPRATTARASSASSPTSSRASPTSRCRSIRTSSTTSSPASSVTIDRPDILIVEGLNILQPGELPKTGKPILFASDFIDFSIYIDADEDDLRRWFMERFQRLRADRVHRPKVVLPPLRRDERRGGDGVRRSGPGTPSTCPTCATTSCRRAAAPT